MRPTNRLDRVTLTYPEIDGVGGKGAALRTIFEIAAALEVQALVVVDSDLRSIVPEWIELLAGPILKGGYDYTTPLYARYKYDGTITNTVTYPLTRALYGHRIRQPIGGDFGVSRRPRPPLPRARRLDRRHQQVRHRHLDDHVGADRWVRGLPDAPRGQGPRPQGSRRGPRADVPPGRGHDPAPRGGPPGRMAQRPRVARRARLRLRADHRPAAARGELDPTPVGVPRRLADPGGHVGPDARRGQPAERDRPGGRRRAGSPSPRRAGSAWVARMPPASERSRWPRRWPPSTSPTTCGRA